MLTLEEFFANKNVFITGGTGFLGTVVIESLLRVSPNIGKIYVLVRGKYGLNPNVRIKKLLAKELFAAHTEESLNKVIPVTGELSEPKYGMTDEIYKELQDNVNIIYHVAATIKFNAPLNTAININVVGTYRSIELAKSLKDLSTYVYVSTAFCNCNNYTGIEEIIEEKFYPTEYDPYDIMRIAESDTEQFPDNDTEEFKKMLNTHPNTYTFSKQIAENLIVREMSGMPVGIVRPSIVYGTYSSPVEGWVGNATSGHVGYFAGYMKGLFRSMSGDHNKALDVIPCDYVSNSALIMGWYVGTRKLDRPEIIHCTSGERNPLNQGDLVKYINEGVAKYPSDKMIWKPSMKMRSGWRYTLSFYLFHIIPALIYYLPERYLKLGKPANSALRFMIAFNKGSKAFDFFLTKNFNYSQKNAHRILSMCNEKDRELYNYDSSSCDWRLLIERNLRGIRYYYYKESKDSTKKHILLWKVMQILEIFGYCVVFLFATFTCMPIFSVPISMALASLVIAFILWL